MLTKYLLPEVTKLERQVNPNASGSEAYGWLPPPLIGEGDKVQTAGCTTSCSIRIRFGRPCSCGCPSSTCRATKRPTLVNYFAAVDNADYPYELTPQRLRERTGCRRPRPTPQRSTKRAHVRRRMAWPWAEQPAEALIAGGSTTR